MKYDRTKTERAAMGMIDDTFYVELGPIHVPYLAFRKSELDRIVSLMEDPKGLLDAIYDMANYRFQGTLPREDFDEFITTQEAMGFVVANRGGQKNPVTETETPH